MEEKISNDTCFISPSAQGLHVILRTFNVFGRFSFRQHFLQWAAINHEPDCYRKNHRAVGRLLGIQVDAPLYHGGIGEADYTVRIHLKNHRSYTDGHQW
jgi:hypothetical protein